MTNTRKMKTPFWIWRHTDNRPICIMKERVSAMDVSRTVYVSMHGTEIWADSPLEVLDVNHLTVLEFSEYITLRIGIGSLDDQQVARLMSLVETINTPEKTKAKRKEALDKSKHEFLPNGYNALVHMSRRC